MSAEHEDIKNINDHYVIPFEREIYNNRNKAMEIVKCIMEILHNAIDADAKNITIKFLSDTYDTPVKLFIYNDGKEIQKDEIDKILKEYKKLKKGQRSNLSHIKKLGLVDKHGRPLK